MGRSLKEPHDDANYLFFNELNRMSENEVVNENGNVATSLPVFNSVPAPSTASSTAPSVLATNALSKTTGKKPKVTLTAEQKASRKLKSNEKKATEEYKTKKAERNAEKDAKALKIQKKYGKFLHGRDKDNNIILATPLEVVRIDAAWTKLIAEQVINNNSDESAPAPTLIDAIEAYKAEKAAKVPLSENQKKERKEIRKTLRGFKINPSAARVTAYTKKKGNFNKLKSNNENARKTLLNYFTEQKAFSPVLKGRRKVKANAKAALETHRVDAERELKLLRTEAQIKKDAGVNPASITHLAMLRQAKYRIKADDFKELSTLVKKEKFTELKDHAAMKSLLAQATTKDACDRCILNTIFLVHVK